MLKNFPFYSMKVVTMASATAATSMRVEDLPDILNSKEVAQVLRICTKTLYEAVQRGEIEAMKIGKRGVLRFRREAILKLLGG